METEFRCKGFISYSHSDEEWAKWLHRARETYRVGKPDEARRYWRVQ
jgi:hypothetical protein